MQFQTRLRSMIMRVMASETRRRWKHTTGRRLMRKKAGPCVHYFHEASDPYSHLAVQKLGDLRGSYDLPFQVHLVSSAKGDYRGDASRYDAWALRDAISVAAGYGVSFPASARLPSSAEVRTAQVKLARLLSAELVGSSDFSSTATRLGGELWRGKVKPEATETKLLEMNSEPHPLVLVGNTLRESLGHYAGGMFYFEGEWYWGLDRLYLLEQRLIDEGFGTGPVLVPRPVAQEPSANGEPSARKEKEPSPEITLEYFPSLRSPYTAISFDRTMALADRTGVKLVIRPVMPMLMRGVSAPRAKQVYVMTDAAREGRAAGCPFGRIVDPFGEPVRRAFSLMPLMQQEGKVREFIGHYLKAAWMDGIDITTDKGLKQVVTDIGVDWQRARESMNNDVWESILETNVNDMLDAGLWGVPSFRIINNKKDGASVFSCWGQDRLWLVEREITKLASSSPAGL